MSATKIAKRDEIARRNEIAWAADERARRQAEEPLWPIWRRSRTSSGFARTRDIGGAQA